MIAKKSDGYVTGMGVLSSHGMGVSTLAKALREGINPFKQSMRADLTFPVVAALINPFDFTEAVNHFKRLPNYLIERALQLGRRAPLTIQASIIAGLEAFEQSELFCRDIDFSRVGLIVAGANTTEGYKYDLYRKFQGELSYLSPTYALHFMDSDQVGTLSELFDIQGEGFTVGGASASGNVAIIQACRLLSQEVVDICLVVGAMADLSPLEIQGFRNIGALGGIHFQNEPQKACRPFDSQHEGFIWGQATGCLVLESLESAKKSQRPIIGKITGTAMKLAANRLTHPTQTDEVSVMQRALTAAGLTADEIQYINTHGTSAPLGDNIEIAAIKELLGEAQKKVWLNSTKSITGHCLWSAGIIEAIATLLQINEGFLHPNLNLDHPIDHNCLFVGEKSENSHIKAALSNSFGFGGINTSIVIMKED